MDVLVVCTANVARSPLATAMVRRLAGDGVTVTSAGTRARVGDPAAPESVRLGHERGLDLDGHRSRPTSRELIVGADLVVTMSERQRDACGMLAPGASARTFTLRELVRLAEAAAPATPASAGSPESEPADTGAVEGAAGGGHPGPTWRSLRDLAHRARPSASRPSDPEDVADPIGRPWDRWVTLGDDLDGLLARLDAALTRLRRA